MTLWEASSTSDNATPKCTIWGGEEEEEKAYLGFSRRRDVGVYSAPRLLVSVRDGEEHAAAPRGGLGRDRDGEVVVERVGHEGLGEAAHVGVRAEAVGGVALEARDEGDGGGEGHADQLRQVQGGQRRAFCRQRRRKQNGWHRDRASQSPQLIINY